MRAAYDTVAQAYAARLPDTWAETAADLAMVHAFAAAVSQDDHPRVLDAGCGAGRMSAYLAARGCQVEGVDLLPGMVAMARRDHPELRFEVGSLAALPYGDGQFAGVVLWYSTIHTPPPASRGSSRRCPGCCAPAVTCSSRPSRATACATTRRWCWPGRRRSGAGLSGGLEELDQGSAVRRQAPAGPGA